MSRFWTPLPHFRGGRAYLGRNLLGTLTVLCVFAVSACGESSPRGYAGSASSDTLQPVSAPPGAGMSPPLPGTTGMAKTADGLPVLGAKGVNTTLFATKLNDEDARMARLENAVQELRNDFDAMSPAIVRLISIEADIQNLIAQLDVLTGKAPENPDVAPIDSAALDEIVPVQPAAVPLPPVPGEESAPLPLDPERVNATPPATDTPQQPQPLAQENAASVSGTPAPETNPAPPAASAPPAAAPVPAPVAQAPSTGIAVNALRVGEHPGKVRLVLDLKGKSAFTADLDNAEKILVIELPLAAWNAEAQSSYASNPVLSSYTTEALQDGGTRVILKLKAATSIAYKGSMDDPATGGSRVIIDLTK